MGNKLGLRIAAPFLLILMSATSAGAQSNQTENTINALGNLFGALAQAGAKAKAQKGWSQLNPQITQCVNTMFSSKNVTVDQLIAAGMAPNDQRITPIINACNVVLTTELKSNFPCTTPNSKGVQVDTMCSQVYARDENGRFTQLSRDEFLVAVGKGEKVQVATLETAAAKAARLQEERRLAEVEHQRWLASPEGKRQVAAEAARARQAALAEKAAKEKLAREYPYRLQLSCQVGNSNVWLGTCLVEGSSLKITKNNIESMYNANNMPSDRDLMLPARFFVSASVGSISDALILVARVTDANGRVLLQKSAGKYGRFFISN